MRRVSQLFFLVALIATSATAADQPPAGQSWESNWNAAFEKAKAEKKLVFVDFYANWCAPCVEMDISVFPQPDVREQMKDFVLLRVNFDRNTNTATKQQVRMLPTYIVYDAAQRERVRFSGGMPLPKFLSAATELRAAAPMFAEASEQLDAGRKADAWILIGNGYARLRMAPKARDAFSTAADEARKAGDRATEKIALAQGAFTYAVDGKAARTLKELVPLRSTVVSPYADALVWVLTAHAAEKAKDTQLAREAFERVIALAPPGGLVEQAKTALARLPQ